MIEHNQFQHGSEGSSDSKEAVLAKALIRVANILGLTLKQLSKIVGKSEPTLSRIFNEKHPKIKIDKDAELVLLLIRAYRTLASILGDNDEKCRLWFHSENHYLGGKPVDCAMQIEGLVSLCNYLDAMRGNV